MAKLSNWWAPVWRGLVCDAEATHYRNMKSALWLYLFLLLHADRRSGHLLRKIKTICHETGLNRDSVLRWLRVLRDHGYIATRNTGRCLEIRIAKWKPLRGVGVSAHQKSGDEHSRSRQSSTGKGGMISLDDYILSRGKQDRPSRTK